MINSQGIQHQYYGYDQNIQNHSSNISNYNYNDNLSYEEIYLIKTQQ